MKRVLMFGTFDTLHPAHLRILRHAKRFGTHLYVIIALDSTVKKVKGRAPIHDQETRRSTLEALPYVDKAVLGHEKDKYQVLSEIKPHVIVLGYDQEAFVDRLIPELEKRELDTEIIRLKPYKEHLYKSSKLR